MQISLDTGWERDLFPVLRASVLVQTTAQLSWHFESAHFLFLFCRLSLLFLLPSSTPLACIFSANSHLVLEIAVTAYKAIESQKVNKFTAAAEAAAAVGEALWQHLHLQVAGPGHVRAGLSRCGSFIVLHLRLALWSQVVHSLTHGFVCLCVCCLTS